MGKKVESRKEANKIKKELLAKAKDSQQISVYKFATKRKFQFFVGTWWEWLSVIS